MNPDFEDGPLLSYMNGDYCIYCRDDLPRYHYKEAPEIGIEELDPADIPGTISFHPPSKRFHSQTGSRDECQGIYPEYGLFHFTLHTPGKPGGSV